MNRRTDRSLVTIADKLGVTYVHLYLVLHRKRESKGLLFTVMKRYPFVLDTLDASTAWLNRADWKLNVRKYKWDGATSRYIKRSKAK